jgi:hypothetical protein
MSNTEDYNPEAFSWDEPFAEESLLMHELSPSLNPDTDPIACLEQAREYAAELSKENLFSGRQISFLLSQECELGVLNEDPVVMEAGGYSGRLNSFCVIKDAQQDPKKPAAYWLGVKITLKGEDPKTEVLLPARTIAGARLEDGHNIFEAEQAVFKKHIPALLDAYFEPSDDEDTEPLGTEALADVGSSSELMKSGGYIELVFANTVDCDIIDADGIEQGNDDLDVVSEFNLAAGAIRGLLRGFRVVFKTQDDELDELAPVVEPKLQVLVYPEGDRGLEFADFSFALPVDEIVDSKVLQRPNWN